MGDIDFNFCSIDQTDPLLGGSIEKAENEVLENEGLTGNFGEEKEDLLKCCSDDLGDLKIQICMEVKEEDHIVVEEEEENILENNISQNIIKGEIAENGYIEFFMNGKTFEINPSIIQANGIGFSHELQNIQNITITTANGNFIVQDGYVYDWNKSMGAYISRIKDSMGDLRPHSKYLDILQGTQSSNIASINFKSYQKNIYILSTILDLELSKNTLNEDEKHKLLLKSAENLNLTYEDKVYVEDLEDNDLMRVVEEKLGGILGRGCFLG